MWYFVGSTLFDEWSRISTNRPLRRTRLIYHRMIGVTGQATALGINPLENWMNINNPCSLTNTGRKKQFSIICYFKAQEYGTFYLSFIVK